MKKGSMNSDAINVCVWHRTSL